MTRDGTKNNNGGAVFIIRHSSGGNMDKAGLVCGHCYKAAHKTKRCFQVIGYPKQWLEKNKNICGNCGSGSSAKGGGRNIKGGNREGQGVVSTARRGSQFPNGGWASQIAIAPVTASDVITETRIVMMVAVALSNCTLEQWNSLAAFPNSQQQQYTTSYSTEKLSSNLKYLNCWIIDFNTSNHMTWDFECIFDIKNIMSWHVALPNQKLTYDEKCGKSSSWTSFGVR